jgi:hypothetical protein
MPQRDAWLFFSTLLIFTDTVTPPYKTKGRSVFLPPDTFVIDYSASLAITCLPLYIPQLPQTLCGALYSPQFGQIERAGTGSFHTLFLLLSLLAFDVFLAGTAILTPSLFDIY